MNEPQPSPESTQPTPESGTPSHSGAADRAANLDMESRKALDREVSNSKSLSMVLLFLLVVLVIVGVMTSSPGPAASGDRLIIARGADAKQLDPQNIEDIESGQTCDLLFEGLVQFTPSHHPGAIDVIGCLAESWEEKDGGLTFEFTLRKNVFFHDGEVLRNKAVKTCFDRLLDPNHELRGPNFSAPYAKYYSMIKSVEAPGDDQFLLRIRLHEPSAIFLKNLAMSPVHVISPKALRESIRVGRFLARGTGPYRLESDQSWRPGESLTLTRFEHYWGEKPLPEKIIFRVIGDPEQRLRALRSGEVHLVTGINPMHVKGLKESGQFNVYEVPVPNVMYVGMNPNPKVVPLNAPVNSEPTVDNPLHPDWLREAISLAIDKEAIVTHIYQGTAIPANSVIPPNVFGHPTDIADTSKRTPERLERARELVRRHGYGPTNPVTVPFHVFPQPRAYLPGPPALAEEIKRQLSEAYIRVEIVISEFAAFLTNLSAGAFPFYVIGWQTDNGDPDNFLSLFIAPDGKPVSLNNSKWVNAEFTAKVAAGARTINPTARAVIYREADEILRDANVILPIAHARVLWFGQKSVQNFAVHPLGHLELHRVTLASATPQPATQPAATGAISAPPSGAGETPGPTR